MRRALLALSASLLAWPAVAEGAAAELSVTDRLDDRRFAAVGTRAYEVGTEAGRYPAIVVNATPIGLFPDVDGRLDVDVGSLRPGMVVADVIPNPPRTRLIRDAEARGATALDGLAMLVNQAIIAVRRWTGVEADAAVMRRTVEALSRS